MAARLAATLSGSSTLSHPAVTSRNTVHRWRLIDKLRFWCLIPLTFKGFSFLKQNLKILSVLKTRRAGLCYCIEGCTLAVLNGEGAWLMFSFVVFILEEVQHVVGRCLTGIPGI